MTVVADTQRLIIRQFTVDDAEFVLKLLNDASFIRYIADKQVRSRDDAIAYLQDGPMASYRRFGFGLNLVYLKGAEVPIGMCGVLKRDELEHPDLGYAFLPRYWGQGYATEAAAAVLEESARAQAMDPVLAVTLPDNLASNRLLQRLGFAFSGTVELYGRRNNLYAYAHRGAGADPSKRR